jgi:hypothetical protein
MVSFPITCPLCGKQRSHYGGCTETQECRAITVGIYRARKLLDLAREINPSLPRDAELADFTVTVCLKKGEVSATFQGPVS